MLNINNIDLSENTQKLILNNGIKIIIDSTPKRQSIALGFFLKRGSRDESINQLGYSHFCEHMLFKGTDKLNQKQIAKYFDKMGGYINAYTTHEMIVIYNRIPHFFLEETSKLIYQVYNNSIFEEKELEMEKKVIINEIRSELEDAHEKVHEYFIKNIFPDQSLGMPIIGNEESIKNVGRNDLYEFYKNRFNSDDLTVVISGNFNTKKIINDFENFQFRRGKKQTTTINAVQQSQQKYFFNILPSEQVHIIMGTSKYQFDNETQIKIGLLNIILGESMSSRFFQKIREEAGLCYSIYTFFNKFRKENLFGLYMSIMPKNINKAVDGVSSVIKELLSFGITYDELEQAKTQKIGEIILNYDILQKRIQRIAFMDIIFGKIYSLNEIISIIKNTTVEDLNNIINTVFIKENFITQALYKKNITIGEWNF